MGFRNTKSKLIDYLAKHKKARIEELSREFGLSRQIIHRHLKNLQEEEAVTKLGKAPLVFYEINESDTAITVQDAPQSKASSFIDDNYLWVSPSGELLYGFEGFQKWVANIKMSPRIHTLMNEYVKIMKDVGRHRNSIGLINATQKLNSTFDENLAIDEVYFMDFYSLPKFGKTRLGQLVLYSKQGQQPKLIKGISTEVNDKVHEIIKKHKINALGIIPPTIPRKIQFLKELEKNLTIKIPKITLVKAYKGDFPVAQKTLSKLEERIQNARSSIHIKDASVKFKNVLLLDDAVGSGASMNEVAKKLKDEGVAKKVFGLAIVGSYKGFDVISEI